MQMKAAVMRVQGKPRPYADCQSVTIEAVDLDPTGPGEAPYKVIGAGLRHSDLPTIEELRPCRPPTIPGREAAGIVEEVGPGVADHKPGDHVVSMFVSSFGDCRYCNNGRSVFTHYAVVSRSALFRIAKDVPLGDATILGCAVATGAGAVTDTAQVPPGGRMVWPGWAMWE